jgi:hypothetical protein
MRYNLDNLENKWLIKIVAFIRRQLRIIEKKLVEEYSVQKDKLEKIKVHKNKLEVELRNMRKEKKTYLLKEAKEDCEKKVHGKKREIENCYEYINLIDNYMLKARKLITQIAILFDKKIYKVNSDYMKVQKPTKKLLKDRRYKYMYDFYQDILKNKSKDDLQKRDHEYKKTEKLYEYYILLSIIKVLTDLGYKWNRRDPLRKRIKDKFILRISAGTVLNFESNKEIIEVHYDEEVDKISDEESEKLDEVQFASSTGNLKPDFRIDIYNKDMKHKKSFVVEVKYRTFDKLYNKYGQTNVFKKMIDYKDRIKLVPRYDNAIEKVLVTYPKGFYYTEKVTKKNGNNIVFIQLSPDENNSEQFGYDNFKNEFSKIIKK